MGILRDQEPHDARFNWNFMPLTYSPAVLDMLANQTIINAETFWSVMPKKEETLEVVVKTKIEPILEEAMQKYLGITINELEQDISEKLEHQRLIGFTIRTDLPFKEAKKDFKKQFLEKNIQTHYGNVSEVADIVGLDRRSVHRDIKSLKLDVKKLKEKLYKAGYFEKEAVDNIIRKTLDSYREFIRPERLDKMYGHVPQLSENIVKVLSSHTMDWKTAEEEFEKAYLQKVLDDQHWNFTKTAKKIQLRYETLLRKMKKLGLRNE
jgi:DNA-binding NtrC family response regulator